MRGTRLPSAGAGLAGCAVSWRSGLREALARVCLEGSFHVATVILGLNFTCLNFLYSEGFLIGDCVTFYVKYFAWGSWQEQSAAPYLLTGTSLLRLY